MRGYDFNKIERAWQKKWASQKHAQWKAGNAKPGKHFFILDMFPYPSGEGLHVGHLEGYTATDIYSRYLRMNGYNVLHPMGWDAFGLPAENYAIAHKVHPEDATKKNIKRFKAQMMAAGLSYDWSRELSTADPEYYKWTQWMFARMFHEGLAYKSEKPINWCPSCKTTLANEDLENGKCERCKSLVERRLMREWMIGITKYADRLLDDLKLLEWPESVKEMQRNWIGRSEGYEFDFRIEHHAEPLRVFTTRLDTLYGITFIALAPEHPLLDVITTPEQREKVRHYTRTVTNKTDLDREAQKEKTGVFTGAYAVHPATKERIPIWVAEYVMMNYANGAIMGVPAHDERDFDFAQKFGLPVIEVVSEGGVAHGKLDRVYVAKGTLINSGPFDRLQASEAADKIAQFVGARNAVKYRLEDWEFARQRYWGEPFPLVYCDACAKRVESGEQAYRGKQYSKGELMNPGWIAVPDAQLPVKLPKVKSYAPTGTGESPLANIKDWVKTTCPKCKGPARRETDTMPQWAGSCWYYFGFALGAQKLKLKAKQSALFWDKKVLKYWLPVNFYVGGVEHATRHLIYARFWHKFLYDIGVMPNLEPFAKLVNQGIILGPDGEKMSKSRGNVINPDDVFAKYGADTLRMYEMFMGPLEASKPWDTQGIIGIHRFLNRAYALANQAFAKAGKQKTRHAAQKPDAQTKAGIERLLHMTIKKVGEDILALRFNTAISALMELQNAITDESQHISGQDLKKTMRSFILLLFPFAPHLASELWSLQDTAAIEKQKWPAYSAALVVRQSVTYIVQVNGKVRDTLPVAPSAEEEEVVKKAKALKKIIPWLEGKKIRHTVFVKGKIVNFVL